MQYSTVYWSLLLHKVIIINVPVHVQQTLDAGGCSEGYDIKCCFDSKVILYWVSE